MEHSKRMRNLVIGLFLLVLAVILPGGASRAGEEQTHTLQLFFENVCASCHEEDDFYELFNRCISPEEKKTITYEIRTYNVFRSADKEVYEKTLAENGKQRTDYALPVLLIDGQWLSGYDNIEKQLHGILLEGKQAEEESASAPEEETEGELAILDMDAGPEEPAVLLFTTYSCADCQEVKDFLQELRTETSFVLKEASVAEGNTIQLFKELLTIFGRTEEEGKVPAAFVGTTALLGKEEIREKLPTLLSDGSAAYKNLENELKKVTGEETMTTANLATLFGAGLLAGFNPCSISMLLMLFSILLTTRASVLKNGVLYLVGKYVTYLGLGFGICFAASRMDQELLNRFGTVVNVVLIVLFLFVAVMNFIDFLNVRKAEYGKVRMQLPKKLRHFNHQLLKKASRMEGAFLGILVLGLGIAVSLGEFFCTGQIYMASILYLLRNAGDQLLLMLGTLLVYVTAMSIPAVVILIVIARTKGTGRVSDFMLKHMGAIKLLNSMLFLFYAAYFLWKM